MFKILLNYTFKVLILQNGSFSENMYYIIVWLLLMEAAGAHF